MSTQLYCRAAELAAQGHLFAVATVVRVQGSSSAKQGAKAIIDAHGKLIEGWVGGGCAESAVRGEAIKCFESEQPALITIDMTDELLGVGMPCGGVMDIYIEPVVPQPELLLVGHGRITESLAAIAKLLGFFVTVNNLASGNEPMASVDRLISEDLDLTNTPIGPRTYVVIATQHKSDHLWLQKALESDAAYIALIASRHRSELIMDYLLATGAPAQKVANVWAPAGLDLGATTPEEVALSIMSHIVALRRGGSARPFKQTEMSPCEKSEAAKPRVIRECNSDPS